MALKRNYQSGTKYAYVTACRVIYGKGLDVHIDICVVEKDYSDSEYLGQESRRTTRCSTSDASYSSHFSIETLNSADSNIIKKSYEYLKTLEDFRDFVDA